MVRDVVSGMDYMSDPGSLFRLLDKNCCNKVLQLGGEMLWESSVLSVGYLVEQADEILSVECRFEGA